MVWSSIQMLFTFIRFAYWLLNYSHSRLLLVTALCLSVFKQIWSNDLTMFCVFLHALIVGHQFQGFDVRNNYIAFNNVDYRNIFAAFGVQLNFTTNVVYNNTGQCIINGSVQEMVRFVLALSWTKYIFNLIYVLQVCNQFDIELHGNGWACYCVEISLTYWMRNWSVSTLGSVDSNLTTFTLVASTFRVIVSFFIKVPFCWKFGNCLKE